MSADTGSRENLVACDVCKCIRSIEAPRSNKRLCYARHGPGTSLTLPALCGRVNELGGFRTDRETSRIADLGMDGILLIGVSTAFSRSPEGVRPISLAEARRGRRG